MKVEMVMPQMGESIAEGTIIRWTKKQGDTVTKDENILEISTDKVDSEIPSPAAGRIVELKAKEGETVPVGHVIAILETDGGASAAAPAPQAQPAEQAQPAQQAQQAQQAEPAPQTQPAQQAQTAQPSEPANKAEVPQTDPAKVEKAEALQRKAQEPEPTTPKADGMGAPASPAASPVSPPPASPQVSAPASPQATPRTAAAPIPRQAGDRFYSPLVRSIANEEGISLDELSAIAGSGRGGRLTRDDLMDYVKTRAPGAKPAVASTAAAGPGQATGRVTKQTSGQPAQQPAVTAAPTPVSSQSGAAAFATAVPGVSYVPSGTGAPGTPHAGRDFEPYPKYTVAETRTTPEGQIEVVQMDTMRQKIAEHMVRSKATSPHVASVTEVDMTPVVRFREQHKAEFEARYGFKLTYTPVIVAATVRALIDYPMVNASVEGTQILIKRYVNVGVAVALESGLIVPVVKHAEEKNFLGIARAINDLAMRARTKKLLPDDVAGGTFAVTNMGGFGNLFGVPIINQPNVGILGAGAIVKRPVVFNDAIAIRDIMYLSLSYDHRVVDGALGGRFIQRVRYYLEQVDLVGGV